MRKPFICGNWKMYKTAAEAVAFVQAAKSLVAGASGVEIGIGAPATALKSCKLSSLSVDYISCHCVAQMT